MIIRIGTTSVAYSYVSGDDRGRKGGGEGIFSAIFVVGVVRTSAKNPVVKNYIPGVLSLE